ncbi:MAG: hypothetical protein J6I60_00955 [Bacteroidaceae bacterium]|nr:hypothetical protein [Bacteroidaceae bacterium]
MGTSQGLTLKTTPQWSSAKRAMTGLLNDLENENKLENFMLKFYQALGSDGIYSGSTTSGGSGSGSSTRSSGGGGSSSHGSRGGGSNGRRSFGRAGASAATNLLGFFSDVRDNGLSQAIEFANTVGVEVPQSPRELINFLCGLTSVDTDADFDSEAANAAQRKLLSEIFKSCENLTDVEEIIKQVDKDTIDAWIIDFEVNYIIEFQGSLFQSHIFDKAQDPDKVAGQIKRWLHSKLDKRLSDEMKHINLFSEDGKRYVESLTVKILDIWKQ